MKNKTIWIVVGIIVVLGIVIFAQYNGLVRADLDVGVKWAEVENQFQRRVDLVPDLVSVANRVATYEKSVIDDVVNARAALAGATASTEDKIAANNELDGAISRLLVVMENYPQIKADQAYIRLMDEMAGTENRIAVARQNYNNSIGDYNVKTRVIPAAWFAKAFGFGIKPYYEVPQESMVKPNYDI
ncbi:MAG: LemA family protein [Clostridiales bacterium]|jgi:LemA protein|nr:LemA family protein [Clostridiales bacterium]